MTISEQLHTSATHRSGSDPKCPKCATQRTPTEIREQLMKFVALCQKVVDLSYGPGKRLLTVDPNGKRYARIAARDADHTQGSVYCFVDLENGDVLKSASWKTPAKGARGNIFDSSEGMARMTAYGAGYNRG